MNRNVKRSKRLTNKSCDWQWLAFGVLTEICSEIAAFFLIRASEPTSVIAILRCSVQAKSLPIASAIIRWALTRLVTAFLLLRNFLKFPARCDDAAGFRILPVVFCPFRVFQQLGDHDLTGSKAWIKTLEAELDEANDATL